MAVDQTLSEPGEVYQDDPLITDNDVLFRIAREDKVVWDSVSGLANGCGSNLFQDNTNPESLARLNVPAPGVSVYVQRLLPGDRSADQVLLLEPSSNRAGVAKLTARVARESGQGVCFWPNGVHESHAIIFALSGPEKTKSDLKKLARGSELVIDPTRTNQ